ARHSLDAEPYVYGIQPGGGEGGGRGAGYFQRNWGRHDSGLELRQRKGDRHYDRYRSSLGLQFSAVEIRRTLSGPSPVVAGGPSRGWLAYESGDRVVSSVGCISSFIAGIFRASGTSPRSDAP